jgi:hypothetical protein
MEMFTIVLGALVALVIVLIVWVAGLSWQISDNNKDINKLKAANKANVNVNYGKMNRRYFDTDSMKEIVP